MTPLLARLLALLVITPALASSAAVAATIAVALTAAVSSWIAQPNAIFSPLDVVPVILSTCLHKLGLPIRHE
jgi:hypothetical protein